MTQETNNLGSLGEKIAAEHLKKQNYQILNFNFKNNLGRRLGEIDVIALDKCAGEIVFIEVKTRHIEKFGETLPEENITYPKLRKLEKIAQVYLKNKNLENSPYRFDAMSVWTDENGEKIEIKHIPCL